MAKQDVVDDADDFCASNIFSAHNFRSKFATRTIYLYSFLRVLIIRYVKNYLEKMADRRIFYGQFRQFSHSFYFLFYDFRYSGSSLQNNAKVFSRVVLSRF